MPVTLPLIPNHRPRAAAPGSADTQAQRTVLRGPAAVGGTVIGDGQTRGRPAGEGDLGLSCVREEDWPDDVYGRVLGEGGQNLLIKRGPGPWAAFAKLFLVVWQEGVR